MESMSNAPYLLLNGRGGLRMGHGKLMDSMIHDGLWDAYEDYHMGNTGEVVAEEYDISRQAQDEWALGSHRKNIFLLRDLGIAPESMSERCLQDIRPGSHDIAGVLERTYRDETWDARLTNALDRQWNAFSRMNEQVVDLVRQKRRSA